MKTLKLSYKADYMQCLFKIVSIFIFINYMFISFAFSDSTEIVKSKGKVKFKSIWKYEQDFTKYYGEDGVSKRVYYLCLNDDGTYNQYVQVIPISNYRYLKAQNYMLDGNWEEKNGKLILDENGKKNAIDYSFFVSNFENIDNQFIDTK